MISLVEERVETGRGHRKEFRNRSLLGGVGMRNKGREK